MRSSVITSSVLSGLTHIWQDNEITYQAKATSRGCKCFPLREGWPGKDSRNNHAEQGHPISDNFDTFERQDLHHRRATERLRLI